MKKIVLTFGLTAGAVLAAMMYLTIPFHDRIGTDWAMIVGYTTMVIAFLLIFFGVRSYRDDVAGGTVRFGRAFVVGILIGAVASACYVAAWEVYYFGFAPDYMEKYEARVLESARAKGESDEALAKRKADMDSFAKMYRNPAINAAVTFCEPLPVALLVSLLSAGVLSRRRRASSGRREAGSPPVTPGEPVQSS
jgi:hypothetical protein